MRLRTSRLAALAAVAVTAGACNSAPPPVGMARGEELYETCAPCHGDAATGNADIAAPSIAGLPQWYIVSQLRSFQNGWRGRHASDLAGLRMRPMAVSLNREGDIESVAEFVASLEPSFPPSTLHGNAGVGAERYVPCVQCHGEDGLGNELLQAPPIVQMHDWYIYQELQDFRTGARGGHPEDTWGATMRANAVLLDDQTMQDLVAYVQTLR